MRRLKQLRRGKMIVEELSKEEYQAWFEHPVTRRVLATFKDRQQTVQRNYWIIEPSLDQLAWLNQARGVLSVLKDILNPEFYEAVNLFEGVKDESISDVGDPNG